MAANFSKDLGAEQQKDVFTIDPTYIKLGYNSRINAETDEAAADVARAVDLYHNGQQQPCIARRLPDGELELVAGAGRLRSVNLIRVGFEHNGKTLKDADRKLTVRVDENLKTDEDAFAASVRENVRKEVSPINIAAAQKVLRDDYKWNDTRIAELYGYKNTNAIARNKKLIAAPKEVQALVHDGSLSTDAALKLVALPKAEQRKLIESGEKLTGPKVVEAIAAYGEAKEKEAKKVEAGAGKADAGAGAEAKGDEKEAAAPKVTRNVAAFKKWVAEYIDREFDGEPVSDLAPEAVEFVKGLLDYFNGVGKDTRLWNRFEKLIDATKK